MSIQAYKIGALLKKDIKDIRHNSSAVLMATMPLFFTVLYRFMNLGGEQLPVEFVLSLGVLMNVSMLPISVMAMIIAEEKEKNTLRTLMLSNVSAGEFLISKAIIILCVAELVNILCFVITGAPFQLATFIPITLLTCICMLAFGATVGISSKNQMSTGVTATPITMLMLLPAIFGQVDEGIAKIARFTPSFAMLELLIGESSKLFSLLVILVWIIVAVTLFVMTYAKKRLDT